MTRDEALAGLVKCQESDDKEMAHMDADEVLCALLTALGYDDVVAEWEKVGKWYA